MGKQLKCKSRTKNYVIVIPFQCYFIIVKSLLMFLFERPSIFYEGLTKLVSWATKVHSTAKLLTCPWGNPEDLTAKCFPHNHILDYCAKHISKTCRHKTLLTPGNGIQFKSEDPSCRRIYLASMTTLCAFTRTQA